MTQQITIFKKAHLWLAHYTDPLVLATFGTDVLPTPFTDHTPVDFVQAEIARKNPGAVVIINR